MSDAAGPGSAGWQALLDALARAGEAVAGLEGGTPDIDVVEGYRHVLHAVADQLDRTAARTTSRPLLVPGVTPLRKLLFDNPDTDYETVAVRGDRTYRIRGQRGTVPYLAVCAYAGSGAGPTRKENRSDADLQFEPDGSFEIVCSAEPAAGNWLPLARDTHTLIARQYHVDRATEVPARFTIELDGPVEPDAPLDAAAFTREAERTAEFVTFLVDLANRRVETARATPNRFAPAGGDGPYATPDADYIVCWYELGPDEALVIDVTPPACRYWGVHLANRWGQSLDSRTRSTVLNTRTATVDDRGTARVVVAARDAGVANWLDTAGHPEGWVLFRWLLATEPSLPTATVVPIDALTRIPEEHL